MFDAPPAPAAETAPPDPKAQAALLMQQQQLAQQWILQQQVVAYHLVTASPKTKCVVSTDRGSVRKMACCCTHKSIGSLVPKIWISPIGFVSKNQC